MSGSSTSISTAGPAPAGAGPRRTAQTDRHLLYSALADRVPRPAHPRAPRRRTPDQILALRVLDPAMGSGAFLVAACRYLADAYETALVRNGGLNIRPVGRRPRRFPPRVAQRCLFGVDLNPMAVQLARLSLWLTTLSGDRPLTFFDHHLRAGNSLVGRPHCRRQHTSLGRTAAARAAAARRTRRGRCVPPVLAARRWTPARRHAGSGPREGVALGRASSPGAARALESGLATCGAPAGSTAMARNERATFGALLDDGAGPERLVRRLSRRAASPGRARRGERERFFHWELEFPEVFHSTTASRWRRLVSMR